MRFLSSATLHTRRGSSVMRREVTLDAVRERFGLADRFVAVALNIGGQLVEPLRSDH